MPDPRLATPVRAAKRGGKWFIVDAKGRKLPGSEPKEDAAEAVKAAGRVNSAWEMAKSVRRAKGAPEITRESRLAEGLRAIEEYAAIAAASGGGLRSLPKGPKGPSLLGRFEERLHPRSRGKFTFSPLAHAQREERHAALERHLSQLQPGDRTELERAKGHGRLVPVTVKRTHDGKYLVEGGGQTFKGVNAGVLRKHDSPRKAARVAIKAWEDAPRRHEPMPAYRSRVATNERLRTGR